MNIGTDSANMVIENRLSGLLLDAAIEVHRTLGGPGLLESVYEEALFFELEHRGIIVERQLFVPIVYKGSTIGNSLKLDLLVGKRVIVEVKATEKDNPIYQTQILTYLRLMKLKLGLVINFGQNRLIDGFTRVIN